MKKPYVVRVSVRKYTNWKKSSFFPTIGGLLGLAVGSDYKRVKWDVEWI